MKNLLLILIAAIFLIACKKESTIKRPMEMWVFRSVMDEKPRMLTAALDDNLWVSYDVQSGLLYKAWKGGVNFDGAVYTTVHGPQPTSSGYAYVQSETEQWVITDQEGNKIDFKFQYKGHAFLEGQLVLKYQFNLSDGQAISVIETPEYIKRGNQNGLTRDFTIAGLGNNQMSLITKVSSLQSENDFIATVPFEKLESRTISYPDGIIYEFDALINLTEGKFQLKVFYHPGFDRLGPAKISTLTEGKNESLGASLINQSDCKTCHNEQLKTVGPAYISIARKYNDSEESATLLANKIIKGGRGVWGEVMMTAHPDLQENDAIEMAKYILSLDDNDEGGNYSKFSLGQKSMPIKLVEPEVKSGTGFAVHTYVMFGEQHPLEVVKSQKPVKQGVLPYIHVLNETDFDEFLENFIMRFNGKLIIPEDGSYSFRLISDDGSFLWIDDQEVINHDGLHGPSPKDGEVWLKKGEHKIEIIYFQAKGGAALSAQWFNRNTEQFELLGGDLIRFSEIDLLETTPYVSAAKLSKYIPGDQQWLEDVHPSFDIFQARPGDFQPRVGGIAFLPDDRMIVCTWDSLGPVYIVDQWQTGDTAKMTVKRIATGLAEPLGLTVVDGIIYVLQKQELTQLVDTNGDDIIDEYNTISDQWKVSSNFHEFAFGLVYQEGFFYAALATAILPGGASANPQIPDRGKVVKINKETGETTFIASGLRTPNGMGIGVDGELFVADNQGDWLPSSKIVHVREGAFYGQRSVDADAMSRVEAPPVVWLPQDEIGNSPSTPLYLDKGMYKGQMIHCEVTHGGVKRVFVEKVDDQYQGAVFRFSQGIEAGVNRMAWAPDGSLIVGGIGVSGNWGQTGKLNYGLQRMVFNDKVTFEMLAVRAKSNGFEIEFTEPIKEGQYVSAEDFNIEQWYYKPTIEYGGPKLGLKKLKVASFHLSDDRKKVFFELPEIKSGHVVYFRIIRPFISENDRSLWTTEAWYTLNAIPAGQPGFQSSMNVSPNSLSENEIASGWKLLFNGNNTSGIRNYKKETLGKKWVVQNGTLHFMGKSAKDDWQSAEGGDIIITDKPYENYELYLEWKISTGGNSGIIFNAVESDSYDYVWQTGMEMQILDNERHPDGQIFKHRAGDLYDLIESKYVTSSGPEAWQRVMLRINNGKLEQWQNGYKVVETELWTEQWNTMVANSKFKDMADFAKSKSGHISLQDHGDKVWFRNIKIREL